MDGNGRCGVRASECHSFCDSHTDCSSAGRGQPAAQQHYNAVIFCQIPVGGSLLHSWSEGSAGAYRNCNGVKAVLYPVQVASLSQGHTEIQTTIHSHTSGQFRAPKNVSYACFWTAKSQIISDHGVSKQ